MSDKVNDPVDKGMIRVLVYGTLKKGHSNHVLISEADGKFIGYDSVSGPYKLFDLGAIPATMDSPKENNEVRGELWAIPPEGLAALDLLEGHPNFYCRRKLVTDIHERRAWVYMLNGDSWASERARPQTSGIWHPSAEEAAFWLRRRNAA